MIMRSKKIKENRYKKYIINNKKLNWYGHASSYCNWHSILKHGLRCYSKTKYMTSGDRYGSGIYLSNNINILKKYCKSYNVYYNNYKYVVV